MFRIAALVLTCVVASCAAALPTQEEAQKIVTQLEFDDWTGHEPAHRREAWIHHRLLLLTIAYPEGTVEILESSGWHYTEHETGPGHTRRTWHGFKVAVQCVSETGIIFKRMECRQVKAERIVPVTFKDYESCCGKWRGLKKERIIGWPDDERRKAAAEYEAVKAEMERTPARQKGVRR